MQGTEGSEQQLHDRIEDIHYQSGVDNSDGPQQGLDRDAVLAGLLIALGELWNDALLGGLSFELRQVDEVDGIHKIHVVLAHERGVLGELHEVGSFEEVLQLGNHRAVARFLQVEDDFRCGHLHRVEAEALADILSQRVGKACVVL